MFTLITGKLDSMEILFKDDYLVAINKPSGLLVHRSSIDSGADRFALQMTRDRIQQKVYPIHRLDKPVSGVLLFALSPEIAKTMIQAFASRLIEKTYLAIVRGYTEESGIIDYPLKQLSGHRKAADPSNTEPLKPAVSTFETLATKELDVAIGRYATSRYSLVKISPKTGRRHQIRRHFKHISHPIIGDTEYGDRKYNRHAQTSWQCQRILLAATEISFSHPQSGQKLVISAPLDPSYLSILQNFRWKEILPTSWIEH